MRCTETSEGCPNDPASTLALLYSMACPNRCDFCCHPIEEYGPASMGVDNAVSWIRQAGEIASFSTVIFTGGEPFVHYRDLLEILERTVDCGLSVSMVTAAHWATSVEQAIDTLRPLKERGLAHLSVSTDPSHQVFVPVTFAENAARASVDLGLGTELVGVFWDPDLRVEDVVRVPDGCSTFKFYASPVGLASRRTITPQTYRLGPERFNPCRYNRGYDFAIYPDGQLYPCCSGGYTVQARLQLGNLNLEPLERLVDRALSDPYARLVTGLGLNCLYELAGFKWPRLRALLPDREPYVSACQLCVRIHSDETLLASLEPILDYTNRFYDTLWEVRDSAPVHRPEIPRS